jgi:hypothetical protein
MKISEGTNMKSEKREARIPLSLHPLEFDKAISDILKIKPEPKPPKVIKAKARKAPSINGNRQPPR